ncbi:hypothetical protein ACP4OV_010521 [Aristida adscensionis]
MVDIGCGSGRFLIWLAKNSGEKRNYLGLEIRLKNWGLGIYFMYANATVSFEQIVSSYPGPLSLVTILCPDPHFKKRHHKRRVLQQSLVDSITKNLCLGGRVLIQSDVLEVAADMRERWLLDNPMGIRRQEKSMLN